MDPVGAAEIEVGFEFEAADATVESGRLMAISLGQGDRAGCG